MCPGGDLNSHGFPHWVLSPTRLPVPSPGLFLFAFFIYYSYLTIFLTSTTNPLATTPTNTPIKA